MKKTTLLLLSLLAIFSTGCFEKKQSVKSPIESPKPVATQTSQQVKQSVKKQSEKKQSEKKQSEKVEINKEQKSRDILYKVEKFNGVPYMTENGKPVRGRVFWGSFGGAVLPKIDDKWSSPSFEFTADKDYQSVNLQLRPGEARGKVYFSKIQVIDKKTGEVVAHGDFEKKSPKARLVRYFCNGIKDNPPVSLTTEKIDGKQMLALHLKDRNPKTLGFHLYMSGIKLKKGVDYKIEVEVKATPQRNLRMALYDTKGGFTLLASNGKSTFVPQVICAKNGGVDYVSCIISGVWTKENEQPNYAYIDNVIKAIIKANPNAKIWPRVGVDAPRWWRMANQDELMKSSDGVINQAFASVSSEKYRKEAYKALQLFIEYCEKNYPENMAGYMPTGQNTGEWFYGGTWLKPLNGYDTSTLKAWRKWLKKKYTTTANLRKAWNRPNVSIDTAEVPTASERSGNGKVGLHKNLKEVNYLINPQENQNVIDFNTFLQDEMVDILAGFGDVIRKYAPRRLSIFFYGYGFEFSGARNSPAVSGHYGLKKLIALPQVDVICGPISYQDRKFGDAKTVMGAAESIAEAGKIWLDEDDTSTYLDVKIMGRCPATDPLLDTQEKTMQVLHRNLAQEAIRNQASWWMDLFGDGWFNDPVLWEQMKLFDKAEKDIIANPTPYRPDIALAFNEESICSIYGGTAPYASTGALLSPARAIFNRCGAPFGHYLLDDILEKKVSPKLNVFLGAYSLTAKQRKQMADVAKTSACIYVLSTGLINSDKNRFSLKSVKRATGFEVKYADDVNAQAMATAEGKKLGLPELIGFNKKIKPLLSIVPQENDIVLARFSNDAPAIVLRPNGKYSQLFVAVPNVPPVLYKHMMKLAGVHVYTNDNASVYANGNYISVVALGDGIVNLNIPSTKDVYNAVSWKKIGKAPNLKLDMKKGDCLFLKLQ